MKTKIFGVLTFAMIVLAGTGIAFGHWYDYAYLNAQITTGYLDVELNSAALPVVTGQCTDCPSTVVATQIMYGDNGLPVANAITAIGDTLNISITNAYPGVCVSGAFSLDNLGTVPAELVPGYPIFAVTDTDSTPGDIYIAAGPNATSAYIFDDGANMMLVAWSFVTPAGAPFTSTALCPGSVVWVHWSICFLEPLEQSTTFYITSTWQFQNCEGTSVPT